MIFPAFRVHNTQYFHAVPEEYYTVLQNNYVVFFSFLWIQLLYDKLRSEHTRTPLPCCYVVAARIYVRSVIEFFGNNSYTYYYRCRYYNCYFIWISSGPEKPFVNAHYSSKNLVNFVHKVKSFLFYRRILIVFKYMCSNVFRYSQSRLFINGSTRTKSVYSRRWVEFSLCRFSIKFRLDWIRTVEWPRKTQQLYEHAPTTTSFERDERHHRVLFQIKTFAKR